MATTLLSLLALVVLVSAAAAAQPAPAPAERTQYADVLQYIDHAWTTLTRSLDQCDVVSDPKMPQQSVLYVPAEYEPGERLARLQQRCNVKVVKLPQRITRPGELNSATLPAHGLLYLEHDYVVPGGFFNEMYGWDSYFIIRGLTRAGRIELAKGMVENFFFEIEHYGSVLNANRSYYFSRSQPPFLSGNVLAVYHAEKERGHDDRAWLARAYDYIVRDHAMWTTEPHLAGTTGLSRYFDRGAGPV